MTFNLLKPSSNEFLINFNTLKSHLHSIPSEDVYMLFINTGKTLPTTTISQFSSDDKVLGCQSSLYLKVFLTNGTIQFDLSSDSLFTKGLCGIFIYLFNNYSINVFLKMDNAWISQLELSEFLSPLRLSGIHHLFTHLQRQCLQLAIIA